MDGARVVQWFSRLAVGMGVASAIAFGCVAAPVGAAELATAQGTIAISDGRPGLRAPACSELVVEARDALDKHLISETRPATDETGACRYTLTVPAQNAVWLHVIPTLVAGTRVVNGAATNLAASGPARPSGGSVGLRFTIIAPTTYFFAPNEQKTVSLTY